MKVVKEDLKQIIVLQDNDVIYIKTLRGNPLLLEVKCKDGTLILDEVTVRKSKIRETPKEKRKDL